MSSEAESVSCAESPQCHTLEPGDDYDEQTHAGASGSENYLVKYFSQSIVILLTNLDCLKSDQHLALQSLEGGVQSCSAEFIESSTDSSDSGDLFVAHVLEDLDDDLRGELHQGDGSAGGVGGGASHIVACFHQTLGVSLTISLLGAGCSCVWPHLHYALSA